jgi:transposase-like protein
MRYTQAEKLEIIRLVETSDLPAKRTLEELGVPRSTFYRWYERYQAAGYVGLTERQPGPHQFWNKIPTAVRETVYHILCKRHGRAKLERLPSSRPERTKPCLTKRNATSKPSAR